MKFADPKNDLAFKKIFGDINHKHILISFLNSVLDFRDDKTIVDVTLANPYQIPKIPELKETILDRWIYFIKNASDLSMIPKLYSSKEEFKDAFEIATQTTWDTRELEVDEMNALRTAEKKGVMYGMERGLEQGLEQGAVNAAISMIEKFKLSVEDVAKELNISVDELKKYLKN